MKFTKLKAIIVKDITVMDDAYTGFSPDIAWDKHTIAKLRRAKSISDIIDALQALGFDREQAKYYMLLRAVNK